MENLGVDENIAQGSGGSDLEGHESSSSEEDVFASKKVKKKGAANRDRQRR
jgi:hypothetical protein